MHAPDHVLLCMFHFIRRLALKRLIELHQREYHIQSDFVCLFVFVALRPMSTAMVIAGRSVHLTTLFPGQA